MNTRARSGCGVGHNTKCLLLGPCSRSCALCDARRAPSHLHSALASASLFVRVCLCADRSGMDYDYAGLAAAMDSDDDSAGTAPGSDQEGDDEEEEEGSEGSEGELQGATFSDMSEEEEEEEDGGSEEEGAQGGASSGSEGEGLSGDDFSGDDEDEEEGGSSDDEFVAALAAEEGLSGAKLTARGGLAGAAALVGDRKGWGNRWRQLRVSPAGCAREFSSEGR